MGTPRKLGSLLRLGLLFAIVVFIFTAQTYGMTDETKPRDFRKQFSGVRSINLSVGIRSHPHMEWKRVKLVKEGYVDKTEEYACTLLREKLPAWVKIQRRRDGLSADAELWIDVYVNREGIFDFKLQLLRPVTLAAGGESFDAIVYECDCHWKVDEWRLGTLPKCVESCVLQFAADFTGFAKAS